MDSITISNLEVFANHGVFVEETRLGQKFLVNACMELDLRPAGRSDDIHKSIHYGEVCRFITDYMQAHTYNLIESAAEHLAEELLLRFPLMDRIRMEIKKPWAPIGLPLETVAVRVERGWEEVCLSIGSNLGDREAYLRDAADALKRLSGIRDLRMSDVIETAPYGKTNQPDFLNAAIVCRTLYPPYVLLDELHRIEEAAGRERTEHWGPRTLDLDIVFYGDWILEEPELTVPHPDMPNRAFVLQPLAQLLPGKVHPVLGKTVAMLLADLA